MASAMIKTTMAGEDDKKAGGADGSMGVTITLQ